MWGRSEGGVWPLPWSINYSNNNDSYAINPSTFQFNSWQSGCSIIDKALKRYKKLAFPGYSNSSKYYNTKANSIVSVTVKVKNGCNNDYPQFGMDESYSIQATSSIGIIVANEVWGPFEPWNLLVI
uniref:Beta-hexosaminidase eukaryotic type N-terminal domain-containing protein n=1 Tax=Panagrolaimus superbus TaxID=310955 RepID=A0A914YB17_9BILA